MRTKLFLLTLAIAITQMGMSSCVNIQSSNESSGKNIEKKFTTEPFDIIDTEAVAKIEFVQSQQTYVRAEGDEEAVNNLRVSNENGKLKIRMIDKKLHNGKSNNMKLTIYISSPELTKINHEGVGAFVLKDKVELDNILIEYEGVGNLIAENLIVNNINIDYEGVGNVKLTGKATTAKFNSDGVGSINAKDFDVDHLTVRALGVGSIKCRANGTIDLSSDGVGGITYWGNPEVLKLNKNGIGKIKSGK